jgi:Tfp pilus assembly protein PilF
MSAYLDAAKQDPANVDALLGAARLLDGQGRFAESADYYHKAHDAQPKSAKVACNQGYSLYLQGHFADAEKSLRQALALEPDNGPAHTDLGLVLAHAGRSSEALAEFHKAGCDEADARVNLAFALTLKKAWPEARAEYQRALAADPSSAAAKKGLQDLEAVMAKAAPAQEESPLAGIP